MLNIVSQLALSYAIYKQFSAAGTHSIALLIELWLTPLREDNKICPSMAGDIGLAQEGGTQD